MKRANVFALTLVSGLFTSSLAVGQTVLTPKISGNELTAKIQLGAGIEADLTITFEQVVGLNPAALSLSATLLDPTDPTVLARLPEGGAVTVPVSFPVLVRIEPTASSALSFSGISRISLHTHNLTLGTNSALRLFKAPSSGPFQDMTGFLAIGSVRAGGGTNSYSDFLIVVDARPLDTVIVGKFDALQTALTAHAASMPPAVHQDLQSRLNNARGLYDGGSFSAAINAVGAFAEEVKRQSGAAIPDVYRANSPVINVAGLLRSAADTLKFSLTVKSSQPSLP
jgi:hypothetical protein